MKKKIFMAAVVLIVVTGVILGALKIINDNREKKQQEELEVSYYTQNSVFDDIVEYKGGNNKYKFIDPNGPNANYWHHNTHVSLALYREETGNSLTYNQVSDYLSQEFEDDGDVRIYTNGRHPEIAEYIEWAKDGAYLNPDGRYYDYLDSLKKTLKRNEAEIAKKFGNVSNLKEKDADRWPIEVINYVAELQREK